MEESKIKILLDKYYSGDILPDEYKTLRSSLNENVKLSPELDAERKMFLSIESCQPSEPKDLEGTLIAAINHKARKKLIIAMLTYSGCAAAIVLIFVMVGMYLCENRDITGSKQIANVSVSHQSVDVQEAVETEVPVNVRQISPVMRQHTSSHSWTSDYELEQSAQIVDDALTDILTSILSAQNDAIEIIDDIEITQTSDLNIL